MIVNENNIREKYFKMRNQPVDVFEITFQMTSECNFRCSYCYETKYPGTLNLESAYKVIDKLFDCQDNLEWWNGFLMGNYTKNNISFNFFGGECFLEVDKMEKICEYFIDKCNTDPEKYKERLKNFKIICQTNGSLLNTPKVKAFITKWEKYMENIFITIDGSKEFHDKCRVLKNGGGPTWQIVHDNIMMIRKEFPNLYIVTKGTLGPETLPMLYDSFLAYFDSGFKRAKITIRNDCKWTDNDLKIADEQYRKIMNYMLEHPTKYKDNYLYTLFAPQRQWEEGERRFECVGSCHANGAGFVLTVDDRLYVCFNFTELSIPKFLGRKDPVLGTVEGGITNEGMEFVNKLLHMIDKYQLEHEECKHCNIQHTCEFCPATNYKMCGDIEQDNKWACEMRKIEQHYALLYQYYRDKLYSDLYDDENRLIMKGEATNEEINRN